MYDALKMKMEKKYGKINDTISFSGKRCFLMKGGMLLSLELETNPSETDTITIGAVHMGIWAAKGAEEVEKKAKELGNF